MKLLIVLLALMAQDVEEIEAEAEEVKTRAEILLEAAYKLPATAKECEGERRALVEVDGMPVRVNCDIWRRWKIAQEEKPK